jgi:hypothetical protein
MTTKAAARHPGLFLLGDLTMARLVRQNQELAEFLTNVRTLELSLMARLLQARKNAEEMRRREPGLKALISLFISGTSPLVDAAMDLGDTSVRDFETGDTATAFLRTRGLIERDAAGLERLAELRVTEDYLVAERIRLGTLLDLVATFLDSLDLMYDLYGEAADAGAGAGPVAAELTDDAPAETTRA